MHNTQAIRQNIGAFAVLMDYAAQKRFGVKNIEFPTTQTGSLARSLNTKIAKESGIDIFQVSSKEDVTRYENTVEEKLKHYIRVHLPSEYETDELEFLKNVIQLPKSYFDNLYIKVKQDFKDKLEQGFNIDFSEDMEIAITRTPDFIECVELKSTFDKEHSLFRVYLVTKQIYQPEPTIIFALIRQNHNEQFAELRFLLTLKSDYFITHVHSPTKIFFQILDRVGMDLEIYNTTKRFFYGKIIPEGGEHYYRQALEQSSIKEKIKESCIYLLSASGRTSEVIELGFAINTMKYKSMRKQHKI
jgi:hypothetical protein